MKIQSCLIIILLALTSQVICLKLSARKVSNLDDKPFLMIYEDERVITGRGIAISGIVTRGKLKAGDTVEIVGLRETKTVQVSEVQGSNVKDGSVRSGDAQILFKNLNRDDLEKGMIIAQPGSIKAYSKFEADVELLSEEDGGTSIPIFTGQSKKLNFWMGFFYGKIEKILSEDGSELEEFGAGNKAKLSVSLTNQLAMEVGTEFTIRVGLKDKVIGSGKVTKLI